MNLDEALRCLLLRKMRERQVAAHSEGRVDVAERIALMAEDLRVTRDREAGVYRLALREGVEWIVPESEFSFYSRGDRPQDSASCLPLVDDVYEKNLERANYWVDTFIRSHERP